MRTRSFLGGVAVGAGLAYFLDPDRGDVRRTRLRERFGYASSDGPVISRSRYGSRAGDIEGLETASLPGAGGRAAAAVSTALRLASGALALYAVTRRGILGSMLRTFGAGLVADTVRGRRPPMVLTGRDRRRVVDIQKTLYVEAPVEQVYAFWSNYENFPLFMSNVREVQDLGRGWSHWSVRGPGGVPIEWNAVLTQQVPNEAIAWRSEPGTVLENAGIIRFRPEGNGTRLDLRFCYLPPAGGAGQATIELLGGDPRAKLNEDLGRLKALLEATVRSDTYGEEPGT